MNIKPRPQYDPTLAERTLYTTEENFLGFLLRTVEEAYLNNRPLDAGNMRIYIDSRLEHLSKAKRSSQK